MAKTVGNIKLFDLDQISEMLGVTKVTLRTYIKNGKLKGRKVGIRWYVTEEHLNEFLHTSETKPETTKPKPEVTPPFEGLIELKSEPPASQYPHITTPDQINEPLNFIRFLVETEHELRKHKLSRTIHSEIGYDWELWFDDKGKVIYASPMSLILTEYASNEFVSDPNLILHIIHPEDKETFLKCLKLDTNQNSSNHYELRFFNRSGKLGWVSMYSKFYTDKQGNPVGLRVCMRDITESKLIEEALKNSEERLRYIVDALPVSIFYIDNEYKYRFNNLYFEKITKYKRHELYGKHIREVFGDRTFETMRPYIDLAFAGTESTIRGKIVTPDGFVSEQIGKICVDRAEDGSVLGIYGIVMEIRKTK